MEKQLLQVRAWQEAVGAPLPEKPTMLDKKRAKLRQSILQEEVTELKNAKDMNDVADAICDILYVTFGTAHEYGLGDRLTMMFDEVHSSNMSKFDEDGKPIYREDGKVMKGDSFRPPNLARILNRRFHLFTKTDKGFSDVIAEISKLQSERWNKRIEGAISEHLSRFDKIKMWIVSKLEKSIKKKLTITHSHDDFFNNVVEISSKNKESKITDVVDY